LFTYTFIDPESSEELGSFTAAGIIVNSEVHGQLTFTGGTGLMAGATGWVEILPAAVDQLINPPLLIQPPISSDPFFGVAAWAHFFEVAAPTALPGAPQVLKQSKNEKGTEFDLGAPRSTASVGTTSFTTLALDLGLLVIFLATL